MWELNEKSVKKFFHNLKIKNSDTVLIHGNSAIINYFDGENNQKKINLFCKLIINYFKKEGTILVPTFTYSFTKTNYFDPLNTKSEIGNFSESMRKIIKIRTYHPIFSFAIYGKKKKNFMNSDNNDCFGEKTIFNQILKENVKIICLACGFNSITFAHFLEQKMKVPYRFNKKFYGHLVLKSKKTKIILNYFVRRLRDKHTPNFSKIKSLANLNNQITFLKGNRMISSSIYAQHFYELGIDLLKKDKYSLVNH